MSGNHFCHICGGLVDLIKLQPSGVRFCECEKRFTQLRADNERLKAELAEAKKERDEIKAQARMLDRMVDERDEQLAAALAACEAKDKALQEVVDLISESSGVYGLHLNGDPSPWEELEMGGRFERLTTLLEALAIKPDAIRKLKETL